MRGGWAYLEQWELVQASRWAADELRPPDRVAWAVAAAGAAVGGAEGARGHRDMPARDSHRQRGR